MRLIRLQVDINAAGVTELTAERLRAVIKAAAEPEGLISTSILSGVMGRARNAQCLPSVGMATVVKVLDEGVFLCDVPHTERKERE